MFAEDGDERSQIADLVTRVEAHCSATPRTIADSPASVRLPDVLGRLHDVQVVRAAVRADRPAPLGRWSRRWAGSPPAAPSPPFLRRLDGARLHCGHLIKGADAAEPDDHRIDWESNQVSVIDIHNLHDRAKRFVVGVVLKRLFEAKETPGQRQAARVPRARRAQQVRPARGMVARSRKCCSTSQSAGAASGSS